MLNHDVNKSCAECDVKEPRWASWNLGVFLCIRCHDIHKRLGSRISKVKHVNLVLESTWTPQQVVCLQQMGNGRARAVYEASLPNNFHRPESEAELEAFIRAKYEHKSFIARDWSAPPLPEVNWENEIKEEAEKLAKKREQPMCQSSSPKPQRSSSTTDSLRHDPPGIQFPNVAASTVSNLAFSSNPLYSMTASGGQTSFLSQKYLCSKCGFSTDREDHEKKCLVDVTHECNQCYAIFPSKALKKEHILNFHFLDELRDKNLFGRELFSRTKLRRHECTMCADYTFFQTKEKLLAHLCEKHPTTTSGRTTLLK